MADAASSSSAPVPAEGTAALGAVAEASPPEEMTLVVKWRGHEQSVRMGRDDTLEELKLRISEDTGVLPMRQTLLHPKVMFKDLPTSTLLSAIPFKPNGKITMVGTIEEEIFVDQEDSPELVDDFEFEQSEVTAIKDKDVYKQKLRQRANQYNDLSIKEMTDQSAKDPALNLMTKQLQRNAQTAGEEGIPPLDPHQYMETMQKLDKKVHTLSTCMGSLSLDAPFLDGLSLQHEASDSGGVGGHNSTVDVQSSPFTNYAKKAVPAKRLAQPKHTKRFLAKQHFAVNELEKKKVHTPQTEATTPSKLTLFQEELSNEELTEYFIEWVRDGKVSKIKEIDIYLYDIEDLPPAFSNAYLVQLKKDPHVPRRWSRQIQGSYKFDKPRFWKHSTRLAQYGQYEEVVCNVYYFYRGPVSGGRVKGVRMLEFGIFNDGKLQQQVLCKMEYTKEFTYTRSQKSKKINGDDTKAKEKPSASQINLPGEPPTWGEEELEEKEMAIINEEIIEALLGQVTLSEILRKEEQDVLKSLEDEKEAKIVVESSRNEILEDLKKARLEEQRLNDQVEMLQNTNKRLQNHNASLQQYNSNLQSEAIKTNDTIAKLQKEKNTMVETMNGLKDHINSVKDQFDLTKTSHTEAVKQNNDLLKEVDRLRSELQHVREDHNIKLAAVTEKLKMCELTAMEARAEHDKQKKMLADGEKLRKKLHNTIIELKGNIRVFCRVRCLQSNKPGAVTYPEDIENKGRGIKLKHNEQVYSFTFDKVFNDLASQETVFTEISELVQSALDGYKVCIFAYGQTGSGKTYTMMGNPEVEEQKGMMPRSLEQIFKASQTLNSQGWKYKMEASMLEIYNETIRDLLSTNQDGGSSKYNIKHDANGNTHVSELTVLDVTSINEVSSVLRRAAQNRSIGRTQMNEESSRSHCVFTLRISGVNEETDQQVQGVLNLIDLAGSERLNKSGATGDRLKEAQAINKSLSSLGDVIFSITKKDKHVPFRNSKLTHFLQPCLEGDSKTLMFVNLSPESSSTGESLCSLRFAARVNSCEIGIPRRQTRNA